MVVNKSHSSRYWVTTYTYSSQETLRNLFSLRCLKFQQALIVFTKISFILSSKPDDVF